MKQIALLITVLFCTSTLSALAPQRSFAGQSHPISRVDMQLTWEPRDPVNGSPVIYRVKPSVELTSLTGRWQNRPVFFEFDQASGMWNGFAGVGIDAAQGVHDLILTGKLPNGSVVSSTHAVTISKATYRSIALSVPQRYTEPDAETLARIRQEQALKKEAFNRVGPGRLWSGSFKTPVEDIITGQFGTERTFNRRRQSVHQGLDLRAAIGTPIAAMNGGEVVLAREMFYEGGFVVIDHGQGLMTLYMHLSEFRVKAGDRVNQGQIIGLSGNTGRVTAPHLHVSVRWQGIYLNPQKLIGMAF